jgi:hypothetical protein
MRARPVCASQATNNTEYGKVVKISRWNDFAVTSLPDSTQALWKNCSLSIISARPDLLATAGLWRKCG